MKTFFAITIDQRGKVAEGTRRCLVLSPAERKTIMFVHIKKKRKSRKNAHQNFVVLTFKNSLME